MFLHTEPTPSERARALLLIAVMFCTGAGVLIAHRASSTPDTAPAAYLITGPAWDCPEGYARPAGPVPSLPVCVRVS